MTRRRPTSALPVCDWLSAMTVSALSPAGLPEEVSDRRGPERDGCERRLNREVGAGGSLRVTAQHRDPRVSLVALKRGRRVRLDEMKGEPKALVGRRRSSEQRMPVVVHSRKSLAVPVHILAPCGGSDKSE